MAEWSRVSKHIPSKKSFDRLSSQGVVHPSCLDHRGLICINIWHSSTKRAFGQLPRGLQNSLAGGLGDNLSSWPRFHHSTPGDMNSQRFCPMSVIKERCLAMHLVPGEPPSPLHSLLTHGQALVLLGGACQAKYLQTGCKSWCSYCSLVSPKLLTSANLANSPAPTGGKLHPDSAAVETEAWKRTQSTGLGLRSTCFPSLCLSAQNSGAGSSLAFPSLLQDSFLPYFCSLHSLKAKSFSFLLSLRNHLLNKSTPALHWPTLFTNPGPCLFTKDSLRG